MKNTHHVDWIECLVRRGHWNHLGWVSNYDWKNPEAASAGRRLQKVLGYRFVLESVTYPARVTPGSAFSVAFRVCNVGSTPMYYNWPVELGLFSELGRERIWKATFANLDIRQWLPGDRWMRSAQWDPVQGRFVLDDLPARYESAPRVHHVTGSFSLPADFKPGRYILTLAILDPAGKRATCRFATKQYFAGGRHPIGRIGVAKDLDQAELDPMWFDDPSADTLVKYRA
jgi:hypothetical protein